MFEDLERDEQWLPAAVAADDPAAEEDPLLRGLVAAERAAATAYLACLDALTALWDATPDLDRSGRRPQVLAEAGVLLGLHPISVEARLAVAFQLQTHPQLRALLAAGRLGVAHVLAAGQETGALGDDHLAARVLAHVLDSGGPDRQPGWTDTPARLRRALARAAVRLDPAGAARRRAEQHRDRTGLRLRPQSDGLAAWTATGPALQMQAADRLLRAAAAAAATADPATSPGEPGGPGDHDSPDDPLSAGQRQIDTLLAALTTRAGGGVTLELQIEVPVAVTTTQPVRGCAPEPTAIRAQLTPDLLHLLSTGTQPATAAATPAAAPAPAAAAARPQMQPGAGPADPEPSTSRPPEPPDDPAHPDAHHTEPADAPDISLDHLRDLGDLAERLEPLEPPADLEDLPPDPVIQQPPEDLHHHESHVFPHADSDQDDADRAARAARRLAQQQERDQHSLGRRTAPGVPRLGVPELLDLGPLDPAALADLLTDPTGLPVGIHRITVRRICTDPTGQAVAVDTRAVPLPRLLHPAARTRQRPASTSPTTRTAPTRTAPTRTAPTRTAPTRTAPTTADPAAASDASPAGRLLARLLHHLPAPPAATSSYRPTADQTRVLHARDRTCTFPGCSRTSRHTDLDHRHPHPTGPTSTSNLHPLCRTHHRLKHTGWTPTRHPDGTTTWTSPHGHHHRTTTT